MYGDSAVHPQHETYRGNANPIGIHSCYDAGKRIAETLFFDYHRQHNVDITIYGDGRQTHSFCYVDDLIDGMYRMMNVEGFTRPANLGNPGEFTMLALAEKVIAKTKSRSKITFKPLPDYDPTQRKPVITLVKEKFGLEPSVALDDGLERTIAYFRGT